MDRRDLNNQPPSTPGKPIGHLLSWQIAVLHVESNSAEDATNFPDYLANQVNIAQALGSAMLEGKNVVTNNEGMSYAVLVSRQQDNGAREILAPDDADYERCAPAVSKLLLEGYDHSMLALYDDGDVVPFVPQADAGTL